MNRNLLYRFFEGHASIEEMKQIKEWAESSEENLRVLYQERKLFDAGQILGSMPMQAAPRKSKARQVGLWREWLKIAAVVAVTFSLTTTWFIFTNHRTALAMQTITVPSGQRVNILLPDSTDVWLNAGTTFSYPTTFGTRQREVELDGEAYFDVTHNEEIPFVVHTSQMDIEVLGTEFNVEAYSDTEHFETSLIQGCVKVSSTSDPEQHVTLAPSQKTTMLDGQLVVENIDDYNVYRWREGLYCFRYKSFADILKDLEKYFDIEIRLENPRIAGIVLTGKFRIPEGLDFILKVLQLDVEFSYSRDIEHNIVYIQ